MNIQTLMLAEDLFPALVTGQKTVTIRTGDRDIKLGKLRFASTEGRIPVDVDVYRVTKTYMCELSDDLAQRDGAANATEMFEAMKRFYPNINWDSVITIVEFNIL